MCMWVGTWAILLPFARVVKSPTLATSPEVLATHVLVVNTFTCKQKNIESCACAHWPSFLPKFVQNLANTLVGLGNRAANLGSEVEGVYHTWE
jgi:hypothetical protein